MVPSKARAYVRELVTSGALAPLPADLRAEAVLEAACEQGLASLLLAALDREHPAWAAELEPRLANERRALLVRTLGQIALAASSIELLDTRGIRALPMKGYLRQRT